MCLNGRKVNVSLCSTTDGYIEAYIYILNIYIYKATLYNMRYVTIKYILYIIPTVKVTLFPPRSDAVGSVKEPLSYFTLVFGVE